MVIASRTVIRAPVKMGIKEATRGASRARATWAPMANGAIVKGPGLGVKRVQQKECERPPADRAQGNRDQEGQKAISEHRGQIEAQDLSPAGPDGFHDPDLVDLLADDGIDRVVHQKQSQDQGQDGHDAHDEKDGVHKGREKMHLGIGDPGARGGRGWSDATRIHALSL